MQSIRGMTMWTFAVLLAGAQATATPDWHSAAWDDSIAAMQGSASDRATEEGAGLAVTAAPAQGRHERSHSISSTLHFEALYRWHHDATRLP